MPSSRPAKRQSERSLQIRVFGYLRWALPDDALAWHVPNSGARASARSLGIVAGIPDVNVAWQGRLYALELKVGSNDLTEIQRDRHAALKRAGIPCGVAKSLEEAKAILLEWGIPLHTKKPDRLTQHLSEALAADCGRTAS